MSFESFSAEQYRDWFVTGVQTMCGEHGEDILQAFAPIAHRIGYARDQSSWTNEVVEVIQELPEDQKQKCCKGVRRGLVTIANNTNDTNWTSLNCALDIARELKIQNASVIQEVSQLIQGRRTALSTEYRTSLLSQCALCLFETDAKERDVVKPLLIEVLKIIRPPIKDNLKTRLIAFGIDPSELMGAIPANFPTPEPK